MEGGRSNFDNLSTLCRFCLKTLVNDKRKLHMFCDESHKKNILQKVLSCLSLIVTEEDYLPKNICLTCVDKLDSFQEFRDTCHKSESMLNQLVSVSMNGNVHMVPITIEKNPKAELSERRVEGEESRRSSPASKSEKNASVEGVWIKVERVDENDAENACDFQSASCKVSDTRKNDGNQSELASNASCSQYRNSSDNNHVRSKSPDKTVAPSTSDNSESCDIVVKTEVLSTADDTERKDLVSSAIVCDDSSELNKNVDNSLDSAVNISEIKEAIESPRSTGLEENVNNSSISNERASPVEQTSVTDTVDVQLSENSHNVSSEVAHEEEEDVIFLSDDSQDFDNYVDHPPGSGPESCPGNNQRVLQQREVQDGLQQRSEDVPFSSSQNKLLSTLHSHLSYSKGFDVLDAEDLLLSSAHGKSSEVRSSFIGDPVGDGHFGPESYLTHRCMHCEKAFVFYSELQRHLRRHTGEKPFVCPICNKRFSQKGNMSLHLRIHSGEKQFACGICGKSFIQKVHLNNHARIHTRGRLYVCKLCHRRFSQRDSLNYHIRMHFRN